jgi:hypothetical protein
MPLKKTVVTAFFWPLPIIILLQTIIAAVILSTALFWTTTLIAISYRATMPTPMPQKFIYGCPIATTFWETIAVVIPTTEFSWSMLNTLTQQAIPVIPIKTAFTPAIQTT